MGLKNLRLIEMQIPALCRQGLQAPTGILEVPIELLDQRLGLGQL